MHRLAHPDIISGLCSTHGYAKLLLMSKENAFPAVSVPAHWHPLALIVHVVASRPSAGDETLNQMTSTVATSSFAIFATQTMCSTVSGNKVEGPPN